MRGRGCAGGVCPGPGLAQSSPGQPAHRCWAGGFLTGQNGDVLVSEESPVGIPRGYPELQQSVSASAPPSPRASADLCVCFFRGRTSQHTSAACADGDDAFAGTSSPRVLRGPPPRAPRLRCSACPCCSPSCTRRACSQCSAPSGECPGLCPDLLRCGRGLWWRTPSDANPCVSALAAPLLPSAPSPSPRATPRLRATWT